MYKICIDYISMDFVYRRMDARINACACIVHTWHARMYEYIGAFMRTRYKYMKAYACIVHTWHGMYGCTNWYIHEDAR